MPRPKVVPRSKTIHQLLLQKGVERLTYQEFSAILASVLGVGSNAARVYLEAGVGLGLWTKKREGFPAKLALIVNPNPVDSGLQSLNI